MTRVCSGTTVSVDARVSMAHRVPGVEDGPAVGNTSAPGSAPSMGGDGTPSVLPPDFQPHFPSSQRRDLVMELSVSPNSVCSLALWSSSLQGICDSSSFPEQERGHWLFLQEGTNPEVPEQVPQQPPTHTLAGVRGGRKASQAPCALLSFHLLWHQHSSSLAAQACAGQAIVLGHEALYLLQRPEASFTSVPAFVPSGTSRALLSLK